MRNLVTFIKGKKEDPILCEDTIFINENFAAIIDGATDKSGIDFGGVSGGRLISSLIADAFENLQGHENLSQTLDIINDNINEALKDYDLEDYERPCASFVAFSKVRNEIWRIGDQHFSVDDQEFLGTKKLDEINSQARALMNHLFQAQGGDLSKSDPGRELIMPILKIQSIFANSCDSPYAYAVINGSDIPSSLHEVYPVDKGVHVVLASDGYPRPYNSLDHAEAELIRILKSDPYCIGENISTKGIEIGQGSYDDRAYISFINESAAVDKIRIPSCI